MYFFRITNCTSECPSTGWTTDSDCWFCITDDFWLEQMWMLASHGQLQDVEVMYRNS